MSNEKKNGKFKRENLMEEIESNNLNELEESDSEKELRNKLLSRNFNYWGKFLFRISLSLKDNNRKVRMSELRATLNFSEKTYISYLFFLTSKKFIIKTEYAQYTITEKLIRFIQKYWFVIKAMQKNEYSPERLEEFLSMTQEDKEEIKPIEEIQNEKATEEKATTK